VVLTMLDRIVLVSGGDKGIGRAIVETLARSHKSVIFTYNTNEAGARELCRTASNCHCFQLDLRDREQAHGLVATITNTFGPVDILINNAGFDSDSTFLKMDGDKWDDVLNVNLRSLYNLTHPVVRQMVDKGWGRIVNLTSIAGFTGAFGKSNYAAAKAGIVGFTKSLCLEFAAKGITCNAVAPGAIVTDMTLRIPEKYRNQILENIPTKRMGTPQEVADLIAFLVSDLACYINGQTIHINGGSYL
jgi:NAD(P)-dependent dehydrogenase (short-subunit alcohol dehydrogenase family)